MARRKSKQGDSQASISRYCKEVANPEDPELFAANEALEHFREAKAWLEEKGCWTKAGSATHAISGLSPMPEAWVGAGKELKRCVICLGDIEWDSPGMGVGQVTMADVTEARRFWYPNGSISAMPDVMCIYDDSSKRRDARKQQRVVCMRKWLFHDFMQGPAAFDVERCPVDCLCHGVGRAPQFGQSGCLCV